MKSLSCLLFIIFLLLPLTVFSGGVDVGNANQKGRFTVPEFPTEESMTAHLEKLLPAIEKGESKEVFNLISKGNCSKGKATFEELEVTPYYRYDKNIKRLNKEFSGEVVISLHDCRKPL